MKRRAGYAAAVLLAAAATYAGARLYMMGTPPAGDAGIRVPAGFASAPAAADLSADAAFAASIKIPERLPRFTLNDLDGKPTPIAAWRGQSLIINFWATWCAPCRREIPLLETVARQWRQHNFTVIGVAVDHRDAVAQFAGRFKVHYPLLCGDQDALNVAAALGVATPAFPFTVFTDRRGQIVALYLGELHAAEINLILAVVQQVNDDRLPLTAGRHAIARGLNRLKAGGNRT